MYKLVVLSVALAVAAAKPSGLGLWNGVGLGAWGGIPLGAHVAPLAAPLAAPIVAAAPIAHAAPAVAVAAAPLLGAAYNYRGPLSLAPGQPANILAQDGRPLDTLSVNVDRALHYTARAVDNSHGAHILGKRSAPLLAPAAWSHTARIDLPAVRSAIAVPALAHAAWRAPVAPLPWGPLGAWGHAAPLGAHW